MATPKPQRPNDEDPFDTTPTSANRDRTKSLRYSQLDTQHLASFSRGSPSQAKRALEAHIIDTDRRIQDASSLGTTLLDQKKQLADRLKDLEAQQDDQEIGSTLKQKLTELEKEYNEVGRETARAFIPKSSRANINFSFNDMDRTPLADKGAGANAGKRSRTESADMASKDSIKKPKSQPQNHKHDLEFATEISTSLLTQVRSLQNALMEKDEALKSAQKENTQMQNDAEVFSQRMKSLDDQEQKYKDENWTLETQVQDLTVQIKELALREQKLQTALGTANLQKGTSEREYEELRHQHGKLTDEHFASQRKHEIHVADLKRDLNDGTAEREEMQRRIDELYSQNKELAKAVAYRARPEQGNDEMDVREDDVVQSIETETPEASPPGSPTKATPRHGGLESETLKSSLTHAHRMIQNLKNNIHREKTEKVELKRMLQDARDEFEQHSVGTPAAANAGRKRQPVRGLDPFKKPVQPRKLGGARTTSEWEDFEIPPAGQASAVRDSDLTTDTSDAFETADEMGAETQTETETDGAFESAADTMAGSTDDDLTETEGELNRSVSTSTSRRPAVHQRRDSFESTASDEGDAFDLTTPLRQPKYKLKLNRGILRRSETPGTRDSPASFISSSSQPGSGLNLASELDGMDDASSAATSRATTVERSPAPPSAGVGAPLTPKTPEFGRRDLAMQSPAPPLPSRPVYIDVGMLTDIWEPEAKTTERIVEIPVEKLVEKPVDRIVEVPVERIIEKPVDRIVEVPVEKLVEKPVDRVVEVPVEKIVEKPVDRIVEVPVERVVEKIVEVPIEKIVERPIEKIVEKPIEVPVEKIVEVPVEKIVEIPVEKRVEVSVEKRIEVPVEKIVEVPVERIVEKPVERVVEVPVEKKIEVPVEKIVEVPIEKIVEVPVEKIVEVPVEKRVEVPVEKVVEVPVEKLVEVPVEVPVEKIVNVPVERIVEVPVEKIVEVPVEKVVEVEKIVEIPKPEATTQEAATQSTPSRHAEREGKLQTSSIIMQALSPRTVSSVAPNLQVSGIMMRSSTPIAPTEPQARDGAATKDAEMPTTPTAFSSAPTSRNDEDLVLTTVPSEGQNGLLAPSTQQFLEDMLAQARLRQAEDNSSRSATTDTWFAGREVEANLSGEPSTPTGSSVAKPTSLIYKPADSTFVTPSQPLADPYVDNGLGLSNHGPTMPTRPAPVPMINSGTQTSVTNEQLDALVKESKRPSSPVMKSATASGRTMSLTTTTDPLALKTLKRPSSSGGVSSTQRGIDVPPLPADHKELIAQARSSSLVSMPPPPLTPTAKGPRDRSSSNLAASPMRGTAINGGTSRHRASSMAGTGMSRRSSVSSFASEIDERFDIHARNGSNLDLPAGAPAVADPRMIQAITQTMIGEFLWKYTRKAGRGDSHSENRHRRFFWIHPYTRTLYWSNQDPSISGRNENKAKSVAIEAVRVISDDNPMPPGLSNKSIVIVTPGRSIKFTAPTASRHEVWFNALSYLLLRSAPQPDDEPARNQNIYSNTSPPNAASYSHQNDHSSNITSEDVAEFNPSTDTRATSRLSHRSAASAGARKSVSAAQRRTASPHRGVADSLASRQSQAAAKRAAATSNPAVPSANGNLEAEFDADGFRKPAKPHRPTSTLTSNSKESNPASDHVAGSKTGRRLSSLTTRISRASFASLGRSRRATRSEQADALENHDSMSSLNRAGTDAHRATGGLVVDESAGHEHTYTQKRRDDGTLENVRACCNGKHDLASLRNRSESRASIGRSVSRSASRLSERAV